MYDIIGDIHGYAKTLIALLKKMGYEDKNGYFQHPGRQAVFVGDLVDRGPAIRETLRIVRAMVENKAAQCIMGNHEYNAICFNTKSNGGAYYLRPHSKRNIKNHIETIDAFASHTDEWAEYLTWIKTLPLYLDLGGIRAIHACWDDKEVNYLEKRLKNAVMDEDFLIRSSVPGTIEYKAIETILKGYEVYLPPGYHYQDRDGNTRKKIRVRWWKSFNSETYRSISLSKDKALPETLIPGKKLEKFSSYTPDRKPVFIGHYWNFGVPELLRSNVCCVDYSIAKREKLTAYRWNGEKVLSNENFVWQKCVDEK
jgi:hypothetical protein